MVSLLEVVRVFISSKQQEFRSERQGMEEVIRNLPLLAPDLAEDWSPEREPVENTFLKRVRNAPIYVGLFGYTYSAPTCLEYETAQENSRRELLIYIKECPERDPRLAEFIQRLDDPKKGHTIKTFKDWQELKPYFERHLWDAVKRMIDNYLRLAEPEPVTRAAGSITVRRWLDAREKLLELGLPGAHKPEMAATWAGRLQEMLLSNQKIRDFS
jgi:hypothetical protein